MRKVGIDRPVLFGLSSSVWSAVSGPITALLIVKYFSQTIQGYHYTFGSLLALQLFIELGLGVVVLQFASHEWSRLSLNGDGYICGDPVAFSRLASLAALAVRWYLVGGVVLVIGLGVGGSLFFASAPDQTVKWLAPWLALCLLSGASICLVPIWSILEGCNQIAPLYGLRLCQNVCTSFVTWAAIAFGFNLWVSAAYSATTLGTGLLFIFVRYRRFFRSLLSFKPTTHVIEWRADILPMQWRIAVSWISGYFVFSLFTPVLFHYHGAVIAGQFGMTWAIIGTVNGLANAWLAPKVPQFGVLIARRDFAQLDRLFFRVVSTVALVISILATCSWGAIYALHTFYPRVGNRLIDPLPAGIFLAAQGIFSASTPFSAYLRAHKREPLMQLSVIAALLTAVSTLVLGAKYSITGIATGYLAVNLIIIPLVVLKWLRFRRMSATPTLAT
jgi:hypothetical protein